MLRFANLADFGVRGTFKFDHTIAHKGYLPIKHKNIHSVVSAASKISNSFKGSKIVYNGYLPI